MPRGKLIVFEGLDRAGKSTQCEKLVETLQQRGQSVKHMRFPDRSTPIGKMIDQYLKGTVKTEDHVIHLLFSANRWELVGDIKSAIESGTHVVIDRYYYSGCAYSAAKNLPDLSISWARRPDEGLPRPDVCIFLDISPEEAAKRAGYSDEKYESEQMQSRVRQMFKELQTSPDKDDFVSIDAGKGQEAVRQHVLDVVAKTFAQVDDGNLPLRTVPAW